MGRKQKSTGDPAFPADWWLPFRDQREGGHHEIELDTHSLWPAIACSQIVVCSQFVLRWNTRHIYSTCDLLQRSRHTTVATRGDNPVLAIVRSPSGLTTSRIAFDKAILRLRTERICPRANSKKRNSSALCEEDLNIYGCCGGPT
jgi:hypothetical protein